MYERFYNLRECPFSLSPDPDYLYPSRFHREGLSYLRYGIEGHAGFVVMTGEIGSGKTTLLQAILRTIDRRTSVSRILNTILEPRELVEAVILGFGLDAGTGAGHGHSKPQLVRDLAHFLVEQRTAGRFALLVIDEAQNLSLPALEEVRMLSNLETEKSKLIQVVLLGQPSLRATLARPELEQLRQRITVRYHLRGLEAPETFAYINHRLRKAAIGAPLEFSRDVTDLIHLHSQGLPRQINVIADAVLLFGYGEERRVIDVSLTADVIDELEATGVIPVPVPARPVAPYRPAIPEAAVALPASTVAPAPPTPPPLATSASGGSTSTLPRAMPSLAAPTLSRAKTSPSTLTPSGAAASAGPVASSRPPAPSASMLPSVAADPPVPARPPVPAGPTVPGTAAAAGTPAIPGARLATPAASATPAVPATAPVRAPVSPMAAASTASPPAAVPSQGSAAGTTRAAPQRGPSAPTPPVVRAAAPGTTPRGSHWDDTIYPGRDGQGVGAGHVRAQTPPRAASTGNAERGSAPTFWVRLCRGLFGVLMQE